MWNQPNDTIQTRKSKNCKIKEGIPPEQQQQQQRLIFARKTIRKMDGTY